MVSPAVSAEAIRGEVAELLGIGVEAIDPGGDLVGQGLDSIRMMTLAGRWRRLGFAVDFATLAAAPTIEAWSDLLLAPSDGAAALDRDTPEPRSAAPSHEPFPLAPMQHAMWVGRQDNQRLGGVAGHLYVEFDGVDIDPERLRAAATRLTLRHPMLRVQFLPDGTQRIRPAAEFPTFPVTVLDLRDLEPDVVDQRLAEIQAAKSHQQLDDAVFELAVSLLPGQRSRLHVDLDMQAADATSYRTLMADLATFYQGRDLPELDYSYPEYRRRVAAQGPRRDADRDWWAERIPQLPDPPALPHAAKHAKQSRAPKSTRRWHWLNPSTRDALFAAARDRGITPAMALAGSFATTLAT